MYTNFIVFEMSANAEKQELSISVQYSNLIIYSGFKWHSMIDK